MLGNYGITSTGFVLKRFEDCYDELVDEYRGLFGADVNVDAGSILGQLINLHALREADLWERLQAVYDATRPTAAEGDALDNLLAITGLSRLAAVPSQVYVLLRGDQADVATTGFTVSDLTRTHDWQLIGDVTINAANATEIQVHVDSVAVGDYTVAIDGVDYTYSATGGDDADSIVAGLAALITAGRDDLTVLTYSDLDILLVRVTDGYSAISASLTGNVSFESIGTVGLFECTDLGPISAPASTLIEIVTPADPTSAVNLLPAMLGRLAETDVEARLRRLIYIRGLNGASAAAVGRRVLEVDDVSSCTVFENDGDVTDGDGRPPHSIECVISGGDDDALVQAIYEAKSAGVNTYGNTDGNALNSNDQVKVIYFSRPEPIYVWVRYTLTYDSEENFPVDGQDQVRAALEAYGPATFTLGRDLLVDKLKVPAYQVPGLALVGVEIATTSTPSGSPVYQGTDIALTSRQLADFDGDRVTFLEA
jgi:uncharacterized phage protein gp47/JayE